VPTCSSEPPEGGSAAEPWLGGLCQFVRLVGRPAFRIFPRCLQCLPIAIVPKDRARVRMLQQRGSAGRPKAALARASTKTEVPPRNPHARARTSVRRSTVVRLAATGGNPTTAFFVATFGKRRAGAGYKQRAEQQAWRTRKRAPATAGASASGICQNSRFRLRETPYRPLPCDEEESCSWRPLAFRGLWTAVENYNYVRPPNVITLSCKSRPPCRPLWAARRLPRLTYDGGSELQPA